MGYIRLAIMIVLFYLCLKQDGPMWPRLASRLLCVKEDLELPILLTKPPKFHSLALQTCAHLALFNAATSNK